MADPSTQHPMPDQTDLLIRSISSLLYSLWPYTLHMTQADSTHSLAFLNNVALLFVSGARNDCAAVATFVNKDNFHVEAIKESPHEPEPPQSQVLRNVKTSDLQQKQDEATLEALGEELLRDPILFCFTKGLDAITPELHGRVLEDLLKKMYQVGANNSRQGAMNTLSSYIVCFGIRKIRRRLNIKINNSMLPHIELLTCSNISKEEFITTRTNVKVKLPQKLEKANERPNLLSPSSPLHDADITHHRQHDRRCLRRLSSPTVSTLINGPGSSPRTGSNHLLAQPHQQHPGRALLRSVSRCNRCAFAQWQTLRCLSTQPSTLLRLFSNLPSSPKRLTFLSITLIPSLHLIDNSALALYITAILERFHSRPSKCISIQQSARRGSRSFITFLIIGFDARSQLLYLDSDVVVTLEELLRGVLPVSPGRVNIYSFGLGSAPLPLSTSTSYFRYHSFNTLHIRLRVRGGVARILQPKDASKTILRAYALTIYNNNYVSSHPGLLEDISWIEEDDFSDWFGRSRPSPRRSRPQSPEYIEISDSDGMEPSGSHSLRPGQTIPSTPKPTPRRAAASAHHHRTVRKKGTLSSSKPGPSSSKLAASCVRPAKRSRVDQNRAVSPPIIVIDSDSDSDLNIKPIIKHEAAEDTPRPRPSKQQTGSENQQKLGRRVKGKGRVKAESDEENAVAVTRQCRVGELVVLNDAPEVWDVPHDVYSSRAYLLDFRSCQERLNWKGKTLSIDAYIKRHCQDAWDGPTGSFTGNNRTSVLAFGGDPVVCRVSKLKCKGAVRCSFGDPDLLKDHTRYEANYQDTKDLIIVPTQEMNARAGSLPSSTLEFYRLVMSLPCPYEDEFGPCEGKPMMRKKSKGRAGNSGTPQRDTKEYFIGCSHWTTRARSEDQEGKMSHTYHHIRREAREDLLLQLFSGELDESDPSLHEFLESSCGVLLHPAHKFRDGKCVYPHSEDGTVKDGVLKAHTCSARLTIYVPEDGLRAIIIPQAEQPHSHPTFPRSKVTHAAEEQYRELVRASSTPRPTVLAVEKDLSPSKLPYVIHPGLINKRKKRDLVYDERQRAFPNGLGIGAVMQLFEAERKLPLQDRYIFVASTTSDNAFVIVTLNPELAQYLHATEFVQVDTTFKRVYGDYNEWKVVVWFCRLNARMCVGRVYTDRSTEATYVEIWKSFFVAVQAATGRPLGFKAFHGSSGTLIGVILDEEGAQGNALELALEHLLSLNPPTTDIGKALRHSGAELILYVIVTCIMHYNRNIEAFVRKLSSADFQYVRSLPYLKSQAEVDEFGEFCTSSEFKELKDWWSHKKSYSWLLPSIVGCLSKIPPKAPTI